MAGVRKEKTETNYNSQLIALFGAIYRAGSKTGAFLYLLHKYSMLTGRFVKKPT